MAYTRKPCYCRKPHEAVVIFDADRNLQRHRAVLTAIARLLPCSAASGAVGRSAVNAHAYDFQMVGNLIIANLVFQKNIKIYKRVMTEINIRKNSFKEVVNVTAV